ncbi:MAG: amidase [Gemmatimonadetes bacterium]|uniref:Amidase n=1 Tax=Candidatus Kutchimonas denitrificans TaxID=3056748 RepID=A0AAE4Z5Q9_9BACT|nr:amidase [Gemmatimonadota bacterium]NIR74259.1 amidase [Candidatus Kutchimonas denitrificans]NIS02514.1 amidase [Gemmatimonadota bacterium]NIT68390.1 amidase [Gemmatimonadota bacterium]NIU51842.1 amidase [Gemmatimonadota bacterium]
MTRRRFLGYFSAIGLSSTLMPGVLWSRVQEQEAPTVTLEMLEDAERLAGLSFTEEERQLMLRGLEEYLESYEALRAVELSNSVPPALYFNPVPPGTAVERPARPFRRSRVRVDGAPAELDELAFWPVTRLAELIESRRVRSVDLTRMYMQRLRTYGPKLECVITVTEALALEQARQADAEIAAGRYRGPLHGIPWGAKDLLAVPEHVTTWGARPYRDQRLEREATVVRRLEEAGAVMVAKLTLGALAWGDVWYGGRTRNPWNYEQGSSGSSAGSAAATAAGLVGFSIGSETYGSIVSPSTRCGTTGLRPTFGRVSRYGAMALAWSMDKIGPICRGVEDCALVLQAIQGPDGLDLSLFDIPFGWDPDIDIQGLRVGYLKSAFEAERRDEEWAELDRRTLAALEALGLELVPIELPDLPVGAMLFILYAEAAAAFDQLTRSDQDDLLVRQTRNAWPNVFRQSRLVPAVEYLQANRVRMLLMQRMSDVMEQVDLYVTPSFGGSNLLLTNLTGHPCVVLPNGFRANGTPTSISFVGRLFGEAEMMAVARAYQNATGFHERHPELQR